VAVLRRRPVGCARTYRPLDISGSHAASNEPIGASRAQSCGVSGGWKPAVNVLSADRAVAEA
jgi:hypothetical protein